MSVARLHNSGVTGKQFAAGFRSCATVPFLTHRRLSSGTDNSQLELSMGLALSGRILAFRVREDVEADAVIGKFLRARWDLKKTEPGAAFGRNQSVVSSHNTLRFVGCERHRGRGDPPCSLCRRWRSTEVTENPS